MKVVLNQSASTAHENTSQKIRSCKIYQHDANWSYMRGYGRTSQLAVPGQIDLRRPGTSKHQVHFAHRWFSTIQCNYLKCMSKIQNRIKWLLYETHSKCKRAIQINSNQIYHQISSFQNAHQAIHAQIHLLITYQCNIKTCISTVSETL